jgi:hypothetical protein
MMNLVGGSMSRVLTLVGLLATACAAEESTPIIESFVQGDARPVDILWVIDDSNSMAEEQLLVGSGIASFVAPQPW